MFSMAGWSFFMLSVPHGGSSVPLSSSVDDLQVVFKFQHLKSSYISTNIAVLCLSLSRWTVNSTIMSPFFSRSSPKEAFH